MQVPGLPLLTRELLQQSGRRRTWITRTVALGGMLLFFLLLTRGMWTRNVFMMLGRGRQMFDVVVVMQFVGVYLLVPLMSYSLITSERERDSLSLLLLTRMGPWTIVLEKLLSPLARVVLLLAASLPFYAVAYSLGGFGPTTLVNAFWCLSMTAVHSACAAIMCSSMSKGSNHAFIATVLCVIVLSTALPVLDAAAFSEYGIGLHQLAFLPDNSDGAWIHTGPGLFYEVGDSSSFLVCLQGSIPMALISVGCLVVGRLFIVRQTLSHGIGVTRWAARMFRRGIDGALNPGSGGRTSLRDFDLPGNDPVAWMSGNKSSIGAGRHQIVLGTLVVMGVISLDILWLILDQHSVDGYAGFTIAVLWIMSVLMVCSRAAGLFGAERTRQTLDILLTTPLSSEEIVRQKMRGVYRLIIAFYVLFFVQISYLMLVADQSRSTPEVICFVASMVTPGIYLPMFAWLATGLGIRAKTAARGTVRSVVTIAAWSIGPPILLGMCGAACLFRGGGEEALVIFLISPATFASMSIASFYGAFSGNDFGLFLVSLVLNTAGYAALLAVFRSWCLSTADRALMRAGPLTGNELTRRQADSPSHP